MKKLIMTFAACLVMGTAAMAQGGEGQPGQQMDKSEMIQKRTERFAKKYGLDEAQSQKLLELNTEYADKISPMGFGGPGKGRGQRGPQGQRRPQGQGGPGQGGPEAGGQPQNPCASGQCTCECCKQKAEDALCDTTCCKPQPQMAPPQDAPQQGEGQMAPPQGDQRPQMGPGQELTEEQKAEMEAKQKEMKANIEAYEKALKEILTDEQYAKYEADRQKRQQRGGRQGGDQGGPSPEGPQGGQQDGEAMPISE